MERSVSKLASSPLSKRSLLCPLCLFSQFYTKIDFLENFATEPLVVIRGALYSPSRFEYSNKAILKR